MLYYTINKDGKRYVDTDGGKVINTTHYATENAPSLRRCLSVKPDSIKPLADKKELEFVSVNGECAEFAVSFATEKRKKFQQKTKRIYLTYFISFLIFYIYIISHYFLKVKGSNCLQSA